MTKRFETYPSLEFGHDQVYFQGELAKSALVFGRNRGELFQVVFEVARQCSELMGHLMAKVGVVVLVVVVVVVEEMRFEVDDAGDDGLKSEKLGSFLVDKEESYLERESGNEDECKLGHLLRGGCPSELVDLVGCWLIYTRSQLAL